VPATNALQEDAVAEENFTQSGAENDRNHSRETNQKMTKLVQTPKLIRLDIPQTTPIPRL
jgi:hypothetical protein